MKKLLAMMLMLLPMLTWGQEPLHKDADIVFFCKRENILEDVGINIVVERVAIYKDNKMAFIKLKDKGDEMIRKIDTSFGSDNMQMHILKDGGCIAVSYETLSLAYSPTDGEKYVAFELDMPNVDKWMRQTGKTK